ncbi:MORC family CW-type zinc finger protein 3-like [Discoglossus pictus]
MAAESTAGIQRSALCPKFLHTNSTSHTWPFSAVAELIDNVYDPDVNAKQMWIDQTFIKTQLCLTFTDNGNGMNQEKLHKMLSFGYSDKVAVNGHVPVGLYGNGFKSGSMRLGRDTIVFTKNETDMSVGMLSQTYLEAINAEHVMVPIILFNKQNILLQLIKTANSKTNLKAILTHSLLSTEKELLAELDAIRSNKGTRIIIWSLRRDRGGRTEFDFDKDKYDIRIPDEIEGTGKRGYKKQERMGQIAPDSDYSLRAYCSILYLKPRMQIILRGQKVQTQLVSKSLAYIEKDVYRPRFLAPKTVQIIFGYNCRNKEHYGMMMYHKNRLIKSYVKVGCQLKAITMGVGVVGVIESNFLKPTHNKQDFDYTDEYRRALKALGMKLDDYWNEKKVKRDRLSQNSPNLPVEDIKKIPDQTWAQCDRCLRWRKIPDGMGKLPDKWYCEMNTDPQFRHCSVSEESENDDEITHSTYEKTHKKRKSEQLHQGFEKSTLLSTSPNKDLQSTVKPTLNISHTPKAFGIRTKKKSTSNNYSLQQPIKKMKISEVETIEVPDVDDSEEEGEVIILEANSTPKPKNVKQTPMETCDDVVPIDEPPTGDTSPVGTQTERASMTVKMIEDTSNDVWKENQLSAGTSICSNCNGAGTHIENNKRKEVYHQITQTDASPELISETELNQLLANYEQALKEINRLKAQYNTLQKLKSENNKVEELELHLDDAFSQLETCSSERDQYKCQIEQLQQENVQLSSMYHQSNTMVPEMTKIKDEASTSSTADESDTWEDHLQHISSILGTIQEASLTIQPDKCQWARADVQYLGYWMGSGQIRPEPAKAEDIAAWPTLQNKKQGMAFLGTAGHYHKFILKLLTDLTWKRVPRIIDWTPACEVSFWDLKEALTCFPVLVTQDYKKSFIVQTDASTFGLGAVLSQKQGSEHSVAYISRKLLLREVAYATLEKECLAVVLALKKLQHYLYGRDFTAATEWQEIMGDC